MFLCYYKIFNKHRCFCRVSKKLGNAPSLPLELTRGRFFSLKNNKKDDDYDDNDVAYWKMIIIMVGFNMRVKNCRFEVTAIHAWDHVQARMYSSSNIIIIISYIHSQYDHNSSFRYIRQYMIIFQLLHSNTRRCPW